MNIKQAKEYIEDTVKLYLKKDEFGEYRIPVVRQRPVFLLGAPGVGKTAIMEQIAAELGIALVSYSMTHHTRQSALGLPFIVHKQYGEMETDVSEYTMSEIISSIYEIMESSGIKEGILFLDEINCVSETLAPSMLQFLQYKVFGRHSVPEGWVIVTAGNPPEYNKSVREFDVVTMDRLKLLEVEADYSVWKEYAYDRRLHGAVINYLEINKEDFYVIDTTAKGRGYVTARGWEDLSTIILLYEEEGLTVSEELVGQYLRNDRIVREFTAYYELYLRYVSDYHVDDILDGNISEKAVEKARLAPFDERLSLIGIFIDRIIGYIKDDCEKTDIVKGLFPVLKAVKTSDKDINEMLAGIIASKKASYDSKLKAGALSDQDKRKEKSAILFLDKAFAEVNSVGDAGREARFGVIKTMFDEAKNDAQKSVEKTKIYIDNLLEFAVRAFGEGNEVVLLLTELTVDKDAAGFLASFGHERYSELSQRLMVDDPNVELLHRIEMLDL